ncbi:hypothetical protein D3C86_1820030 [compost metagenome]
MAGLLLVEAEVILPWAAQLAIPPLTRIGVGRRCLRCFVQQALYAQGVEGARMSGVGGCGSEAIAIRGKQARPGLHRSGQQQACDQ